MASGFNSFPKVMALKWVVTISQTFSSSSSAAVAAQPTRHPIVFITASFKIGTSSDMFSPLSPSASDAVLSCTGSSAVPSSLKLVPELSPVLSSVFSPAEGAPASPPFPQPASTDTAIIETNKKAIAFFLILPNPPECDYIWIIPKHPPYFPVFFAVCLPHFAFLGIYFLFIWC